MSTENHFIDRLNCRDVVVVRWDQDDTTSLVPSAPATLHFIKSVGYKLGNNEGLRCYPNASDPDQYLVISMESEDEAKRICHDSDTKGFGINNTRIFINRLLGPNGIRIRDATDCIRIWHDVCDEDTLMDLLIGLIGMEAPERAEVVETGFRLIKAGVSELVENGNCHIFGSFASLARRTGFSDVDINIGSFDTVENPGSTKIRPLQKLRDQPKCLIKSPLTKAELYSFPPEDIIKALYRCMKDNQMFKKLFEIRFVPARTPILIFKSIQVEAMNITYDVSVNNQIGVDKADLLELFMMRDTSEKKKTRRVMMFIVHWARSNALMGGAYPEEKLPTKNNFNSYIFNQMVIHFIQTVADKMLVYPQAKAETRVLEYNFDDLFTSYTHFLREFFKYYATFDFAHKAIYGKQVMQKVTVANVHGVVESPLMMMDPMDYTHNISAKVTEDGMRLLNGLTRSALLIMLFFQLKQKFFRLQLLLRTAETAAFLMHSAKESHTCTTTSQVPPALSEFASVCSGHQEYLTFQLPDIIQSSAEFMLLLTRVLRFDVSPDHEGPSVSSLYNTMGVIFVVHTKSWVGRRNKKRQLKNVRRETTNLQLDVMCSDAYTYEDEPIAVLRVAMSDVSDSARKIVYVEMLKGQVADVRDAMHYLIDQFMANNLVELLQDGIMSIADIPSLNASA